MTAGPKVKHDTAAGLRADGPDGSGAYDGAADAAASDGAADAAASDGAADAAACEPGAASCAVAAASCDAALVGVFGFLGKRWNGLIIATLTSGPTGFASLARAVAGISDSVLSERLAGLSQAGIVVRSVEPGPPVSVTYELSSAGMALLPAISELTRWAREHAAALETAPR